SEFDAATIARSTSQWVTPPGVQDAQVRYECRLRDVLVLADTPMSGSMMLLDVIGVSVNDNLLRNGMLAPALVDAVGKLGGDLYSTTREQNERQRPVLSAK
ncbi:MAG: flavin reductase family protein, partial [Brachymonas sp.]|nr:flavin reductase family protein [Brachymonas sp.]